MNDERINQETVLREDGAVTKRPWHRPDLQEVDVFDTEAGSGYPAADASTYTS